MGVEWGGDIDLDPRQTTTFDEQRDQLGVRFCYVPAAWAGQTKKTGGFAD
jgi:hypothetical protein